MKVIFYFSLYKYIVWLEISTRKYAFGYEKLTKRKKRRKINWMSKRINGSIDVAIDQLKGLISYFKGYRENGFTSAINSSKKISLEMEI